MGRKKPKHVTGPTPNVRNAGDPDDDSAELRRQLALKDQQLEQMQQQQHLMQLQMQAQMSQLQKDMDVKIKEQMETLRFTQRINATLLSSKENPFAICIQRWTRGWLARRLFTKRMTALILLQSMVRPLPTQLSWKATQVASIKIQTFWRGFQARKNLACHIAAAICIQRFTRGSQTRRSSHCKVEAIKSIQHVGRGFIARCYFIRARAAAILIQATTRGHSLRRPQLFAMLHRKHARLEREKDDELHRLRSELATKDAQNQELIVDNQRLQKAVDDSTLIRSLWSLVAKDLDSVIEAQCCPITHEPIKKAMLCSEDKHIYEETAIKKWINDRGTSHATSPLTRERILYQNLKSVSGWEGIPTSVSDLLESLNDADAVPFSMWRIPDFLELANNPYAGGIISQSGTLRFEIPHVLSKHRYSFKLTMTVSEDRKHVGLFFGLDISHGDNLQWPMAHGTVTLTVMNPENTTSSTAITIDVGVVGSIWGIRHAFTWSEVSKWTLGSDLVIGASYKVSERLTVIPEVTH